MRDWRGQNCRRRSHAANDSACYQTGNVMQDKSVVVTKGLSFFANQADFFSSYFYLNVVEEALWQVRNSNNNNGTSRTGASPTWISLASTCGVSATTKTPSIWWPAPPSSKAALICIPIIC